MANYIEEMGAPGYERLADVLHRAFLQASEGKGHERHSNGEPFHEQVMQTGAQRFGVGSLLYQAFKKSEESQRLPHDAAVRELLGAINYLAGAVIAMERTHSAATVAPKAANDNAPQRANTDHDRRAYASVFGQVCCVGYTHRENCAGCPCNRHG
ncbi:hypothetical protein AB7813_08185 [Tardiphaga sp. 20_F10_N6_6]|uniref:hypothetical protein n=1 Tax=Tardiphaga sp. 20_F10_N6_6 TaxID=3240788 RepID=UPI003F8CE375